MTMKSIFLCAFLAAMVGYTMGLKCFTCINARSNDECNKKGRMEKCRHNERSCENELRLSENGFGYMLTKRCKQVRACINNQNQNFLPGWNNTQCDPLFPQNSVCRCCCTGDLCNRLEMPCNEIQNCDKRGAVKNGRVVCTNYNFVNSSCKYECKSGYTLIGDATVTCGLNDYGFKWSSAEPRCQANSCTRSLKSLRNGRISCSDSNKIRSECTFTCNRGYRLKGEKSTVCQANTRWSEQIPVCDQIKCEQKKFTSISNGNVRCSDGDVFDSVCRFSCKEGFYLVGFGASTCQENSLWSHDAPTCKIITCEEKVIAPTNGKVVCSKDNMYNSVCEFKCDLGYYMVGEQSMTCQGDFQWSNKAPICRKVRCEPTLPAPSNGGMICSDGNVYASVCLFACSEGYNMVGSETSFCQENFRWSDTPATCEQITCDPLTNSDLSNGQVVCSEGNVYGSKCNFACNEGFYITGDTSSTCTDKGWGIKDMPFCERYTCPEPEAPVNGYLTCSEDNLSFSQCNYTCGNNPKKWESLGDQSTSCVMNPELNMYLWNNDPPCCARKCPPYAQIDLFLILDSSSSVGKANWKKTVDFVEKVINNYFISETDMLVAAIRYNKKVDSKSEIKLGEFMDNNSTVKALRNIPYDGSGTYTGQALQYAVDNMLTHKGNRPTVKDMVLILTDGISQDDVKLPARRLRSTGTNVVALGIVNQRGGLKEADLLDITNDREKTIMLPDGFDGLTQENANKITKQICQSPCERVNQYNGMFQLGL